MKVVKNGKKWDLMGDSKVPLDTYRTKKAAIEAMADFIAKELEEAPSPAATPLDPTECLQMFKYLAKHENNERVKGFLSDRGVCWEDA